MIRAALTILGKDLRLRARDRSVFMFAIVVPLGLMVLFSFLMPGEEDLTVRAAVVDEDGGMASTPFVTEVLPALEEGGLVELRTFDDGEAARTALEGGELDALWWFPAGFSADLEAGAGARLEVLVDASSPLGAEVARGIAEAYAGELDRVVLAVATTATAADGEPSDELLEQVAEEAAADAPLVQLADVPAEDRQLDMTSYLAAGMAAFFVFFTVQFGVTGLLEERTLGTLPRLLASPVPRGAVQAGKLAGAFVLGVVSMTVLAITAAIALGARWGPAPGVAILVVAMVLAALGVMGLVGGFAKTAEQAGNLQSVVAVVLGLLGGVFIPMPLGDGPLGYLTFVAPHGWFLDGLAAQAGSGDWRRVLPHAAAILGFAAVTGVLAWARGRRVEAW